MIIKFVLLNFTKPLFLKILIDLIFDPNKIQKNACDSSCEIIYNFAGFGRILSASKPRIKLMLIINKVS